MKQHIDESIDYDAMLVEEYKLNYIMEEEGIGADEAEPYDIQTTFETEEDAKDIYGEGCEIEDES
jgi:hypothetical protein